MTQRVVSRLYAVLASKWFWWAILALFLFEAVWLAYSGRYPMAADEDFHVGIIKLYAEQWSPFFAAQPANADGFGAVVRDPSFLHHWLLAVPYRLADRFFNGDQYGVIMALRLINVAFFAAGLVVFRRLMLMAKASPALAHLSLLFFVLLPVVPFVASQVNYDNLLFPLTGLAFLLAARLLPALRQQNVPATSVLLLASVLMLASLVKYAFLPIMLAIVVFLFAYAWRSGLKPAGLWKRGIADFRTSGRAARLAALVMVLMSAALFLPTYGYNTLRYATPAPECDQVLGVERCRAYGAWNRNYLYAQSNPVVDHNPVRFTDTWGNNYLRGLFQVVNGSYSGFFIGVPLKVLNLTMLAVFWAGLVLLVWKRRSVFDRPAYVMFGVVALSYVAVLWIQNYGEFIRLNEHVAQQGRYLLIVLPVIFLLVARAFSHALGKHQGTKLAVLAVLLVAFTQGGGSLTYLVRSGESWWWERPGTVERNKAAQNAVRPFIYDSHEASREDHPENLD